MKHLGGHYEGKKNRIPNILPRVIKQNVNFIIENVNYNTTVAYRCPHVIEFTVPAIIRIMIILTSKHDTILTVFILISN